MVLIREQWKIHEQFPSFNMLKVTALNSDINASFYVLHKNLYT
jgi:hypothetical protein